MKRAARGKQTNPRVWSTLTAQNGNQRARPSETWGLSRCLPSEVVRGICVSSLAGESIVDTPKMGASCQASSVQGGGQIVSLALKWLIAARMRGLFDRLARREVVGGVQG